MVSGRERFESVDVSEFDEPEPPLERALVRIVSLDTFADTPEKGAEAVLGTAENVVFGADSDGMFYGDGGSRQDDADARPRPAPGRR